MKNPPTRHILLAVAGNTAATVTEAIHALAVTGGKSLSQVVVLTTQGAEKSLRDAFAEVLPAMRRDFPRQLGKLPDPDVRFIRLDDIRTGEDNEKLADWILGQVAEVCSTDATVVHASLTGGRKTMSFYLGAAMQLAGRPQDHLYHVLVSPEFEVPGFYYPAPQKSKYDSVIVRGQPRPSRDARIDLAEVPFAPMRGVLADIIGTSVEMPSFRRVVGRAKDCIGQDYLRVEVAIHKSKSGWVVLRFLDEATGKVAELEKRASGKEIILYTWLLSLAAGGQRDLSLTSVPDFEVNYTSYVRWVEKLTGTKADTALARIGKNWKDVKSDDERSELVQIEWYAGILAQHPSRLNKAINELFAAELPERDPTKYHIKLPAKGHMGIDVPPDRIKFSWRKARA